MDFEGMRGVVGARLTVFDLALGSVTYAANRPRWPELSEVSPTSSRHIAGRVSDCACPDIGIGGAA